MCFLGLRPGVGIQFLGLKAGLGVGLGKDGPVNTLSGCCLDIFSKPSTLGQVFVGLGKDSPVNILSSCCLDMFLKPPTFLNISRIINS